MQNTINVLFINNFLIKKKGTRILNILTSKFMLKLLNILIFYGYILRYKIITKNRIKIFFKKKYKIHIISLSKPTVRFHVKYKELFSVKFKNPCNVFFLYTTKGILTINDAIKKKVGGFFICTVNFLN